MLFAILLAFILAVIGRSAFAIESINDKNALKMSDKGYAVLDFYADWCGPCKMLHPVLEQIEKAMPNVHFYQINTDSEDSKNTASYFCPGSFGIPRIMLLKNGSNPKLIQTGYEDYEQTKKNIEDAIKESK